VIEDLLEKVVTWATSRHDVRAVAVVGSHARGAARPDSDVDLLLLSERPDDLVSDTTWLGAFGVMTRQAVEDWGRVTSVRAWYIDGGEVEFGVASPDWAANPDEGTRRVLRDGFRVVLDRDGAFGKLEGL
jgi:hypothetical protein